MVLGDTSQYAFPGTTGSAGCLGLQVASGAPLVIPVDKGMENRAEIRFRIKLDRTGDARITRESAFFGTLFAEKNKQFSEMTPELRRRYYLETVTAIAQSAEPLSDLATDFASYPGKEVFSVYFYH